MKKHIFIFVLPVLYSTYTVPNGLFSMLKHRLNLYLLTKSYQQHESMYNKQFKRALNKTEYPKITKVCSYLFWHNYYVRKDLLDCYTMKDWIDLGLYGKQTFESQKKDAVLYDQLVEMKQTIFEDVSKQVYDDMYYDKAKKLRNKIDTYKKSVLDESIKTNTFVNEL